MSIATDVASLQIMADIYQKKSSNQILQKTVDCLTEQVTYIDWAGIYHAEPDEEPNLLAASNEETDMSWETNAELKFPIEDAAGSTIGVLVVKSREAICFDVTDVSTLEEIAAGLAEIVFAN
ncbi:GAF domain-containing protein [Alteribacter lacisalsi]|uniref:GAF domain-containing protein n=1 Tax=Alteribacter lacisalsi TaxID=2045244 RepID=A0A2W0HA26_9BACI|nr:GAF domain-containing protein [Alteribacter lacisalsi]PYZ96900.1 GAF domain-containing protein [Alteribacter lacisalsi]